MSTLFSPDSVFLQRFLRSGGYYKGNIDGLVGPKTAAALREFEVDTQQIANEIRAFDKRTEAAFGHPQAALSQCFTVRILSGTRTFAEQAGHFDVRHQSELCDGTERDHLFPLRTRRRYLRSRDAGVVDRINRCVDPSGDFPK